MSRTEAESEPLRLNRRQRAAVESAARAATSLLRGGATAFGRVVEGELLRAAHSCRIAGLHRLAGALLRLVERGREYRDQQPQFRLEALAGDLQDVLSTSWRLRDGLGTRYLVGTARRAYRPEGSLVLYGLFTEPVVSATGYAGVVTYLADADGRGWTVADVTPGEAVRCRVAYRTPVALGDSGLSHAALSRGGIRLQGATASADGRLGSGREVRAVEADARGWRELPLARLWEEPLDRQLDRIWSALDIPLTSRRAGSDLLFLRARVMGVRGSVLITELIGAAGQLACSPPSDHVELAYVDNLRLLGACPGLELMLVGRLRPGMPRAVRLLAVGALESPGGAHGLVVPKEWLGRVNLGLDRLQRGNLPGAAARPVVFGRSEDESPAADPLDIVRRRVLQVAAGGAATVGQSAWSGMEADERALERAQLRTAATLLRALRAAAVMQPSADGADPLARAWTALRQYERHASARLERMRWA